MIKPMNNQFSRTEILYGEEAMQKLFKSRVAVFGIGGVGCYAVEALARSGIGALDLIDGDTFCESNLNRQLYALHSTLNKNKAEVAAERAADVNPAIRTRVFKTFYFPETAAQFDFKEYDYIVDAVDTVTAKTEIIVNAKKAGVPVISCMATGNKVNPSMLEVDDIYNTSVCPLSRVMRNELRKRGVENLKVVYSKEEPFKTKLFDEASGKPIPASTAFVPASAGLLIASEVVKDLTASIG